MLAQKQKFTAWSDDDMRIFCREISRTGMAPADALLVYFLESGLQPWIFNVHGSYGIDQAQSAMLRAAGWKDSSPAYLALSVAQQIPYVAKVLRIQIATIGYVPADAAELLRVQLSPRAAKLKDDVIYKRGTSAYVANRWLDRGNKGAITMEDLRRELQAVSLRPFFQQHLAMLRRVEHDAKPII
jgi:hypothetical protein